MGSVCKLPGRVKTIPIFGILSLSVCVCVCVCVSASLSLCVCVSLEAGQALGHGSDNHMEPNLPKIIGLHRRVEQLTRVTGWM